MISGGKRWAHLRLVSALTNLNLLGGGEGGGLLGIAFFYTCSENAGLLLSPQMGCQFRTLSRRLCSGTSP